MSALFNGGTSQRCSFDPTGFLSPGTAYTFLAWVKETAKNDYINYMGVGPGGGGGPNLGLGFRNVADPVVGMYAKAGTAGDGVDLGYDAGPALNTWNAIGYSWSGGAAGVGGALKVYRQGVLRLGPAARTVGSTGDLFFGKANDHSLSGKLGPMYLFLGVLSDAQVLAQLAQLAPVVAAKGYWPILGDFLDASGNGYNLANAGAITFDADYPTFRRTCRNRG